MQVGFYFIRDLQAGASMNFLRPAIVAHFEQHLTGGRSFFGNSETVYFTHMGHIWVESHRQLTCFAPSSGLRSLVPDVPGSGVNRLVASLRTTENARRYLLRRSDHRPSIGISPFRLEGPILGLLERFPFDRWPQRTWWGLR